MASPPPAPTVLRAVSLDFDDTLIESEAMKRAALVRVASAFDGGEAALHSGSDVTNPDTIFGFVQWGSGGVRADVAAKAGIWPDGASVEPDPAFNSIELFGDPADPESWS